MRNGIIATVLGMALMDCATSTEGLQLAEPPRHTLPGPAKGLIRTTSATNASVLSTSAQLATAYILMGACPNWNESLGIARKKMGCTGATSLSATCQKNLPCDVCQFLVQGVWPEARIVEFPAEDVQGINNSIYGAVRWDPKWEKTCPVGDKTRAEFKQALCFGDGLWGFDKKNTLAKAMVHEALHLCKATGGDGSATIDKRFWDYLFCPDGDTAGAVEICWDSGQSEELR